MRRSLLPIQLLPAWIALNGIQLNGVEIRDLGSKGRGLVATKKAKEEGICFVNVPSSMVLSKDTIWEYAKSDKHLREVLEASGDFAKVRIEFPLRMPLSFTYEVDTSRSHSHFSSHPNSHELAGHAKENGSL